MFANTGWMCATLAVAFGGLADGAIRLEAIDAAGAGYPIGLGLSGDGNVVVGSLLPVQTAFRWSAATLEFNTIPLPETIAQPLAHVCSYDGTTIGLSNGTNAAYRHRGFVTSPSRDPILQGLGATGDVRFCSHDGEVLAGSAGATGWRWSTRGGLETFADFAVWSATPSGAVLAGRSSYRAAIRDAIGTVRLLPLPPGAEGLGTAEEISADASIVAGTIGTRCYRWEGDVASLIPTVPGVSLSSMRVQGMDDSGNVILGSFTTTTAGRGIWLWTPALGTVNLRTYLQSRGVGVGGFPFVDGIDVSSDGLAMIGAFGASYSTFYLRFDTLPIPAPSAAVPLLLGFAVAAGRRRR